MVQTVAQYRKAFQRKKGESEADATKRQEARIETLLKEGKLRADETKEDARVGPAKDTPSQKS